MQDRKSSLTLLRKKDIELLKDFELEKNSEFNLMENENISIELHVYDLAGNRIFSKHKIDRDTWEVVTENELLIEAEKTSSDSLDNNQINSN